MSDQSISKILKGKNKLIRNILFNCFLKFCSLHCFTIFLNSCGGSCPSTWWSLKITSCSYRVMDIRSYHVCVLRLSLATPLDEGTHLTQEDHYDLEKSATECSLLVWNTVKTIPAQQNIVQAWWICQYFVKRSGGISRVWLVNVLICFIMLSLSPASYMNFVKYSQDLIIHKFW